MVLYSELLPSGELFGTTLGVTERNSHGRCLLFLATAIATRKHWPSYVPAFSAKLRSKSTPGNPHSPTGDLEKPDRQLAPAPDAH
jgi:hypothetical protein